MIENTIHLNIDEEFEYSVEEASKLFFSGKIFIYPTDTLYGIGGDPSNDSVMTRIKVLNIDEEFEYSVEEASKLFFSGKIFIYPTDTIYGIGGDPSNDSVMTLIKVLKQRGDGKQFILLINDVSYLNDYVDLNSTSHIDFLRKIWPGPVSVIMKSGSQVADKFRMETIAFRIPDSRFCLNLLEKIKSPLISTSVNKLGQLPMTDYIEIRKEYNSKVDAIFYSNQILDSAPSTIIDLTGKEPILIREGKINFVELLKKFS